MKKVSRDRKTYSSEIKGWTWTFTCDEKCFDAYTTLYLLDFIVSNNLKEEINEIDVQDVITEILNQQIMENKNIELPFGIKRNIKGSWKNIFWGEEQPQIDITAEMTMILGKLVNKKNEKNYKISLENSTNFVKNAFKEENYLNEDRISDINPYVLDFPPHEDYKGKVNVSDITGTNSAVQMLMKCDTDITKWTVEGENILQIIKWLISKQNDNGSWPKLSTNCLNWAEKKDEHLIVSKNKLKNESLTNTVNSLKTLITWIDYYVSGK